MSNFVQTLITMFTQYVTKWLASQGINIDPSILSAKLTAHATANPMADPVPAAPADIYPAVQQFLYQFVQQAFANQFVTRNLVTAFVNHLPQSFVDSLWNQLFGTTPAPQAMTAKPTPTLGEMVAAECAD
jgi:hypothetical protein